MKRRVFVGGAVAGLALSATGLNAQQRIRGGIIAKPPRTLLCRTRKDIRSLTAAELTAFKNGVSTMMARPASDPTSWAYQAAIHGSLASPALPLWNSCEHGTLHFFSWHRLFLYYFERILRAASGSSSLTLPYWNWQSQRELPAPFVDSTAGNPLFVTNRSAAMNSGGQLPSSSVSAATAFAHTAFNSFSSSIEGTPHGAVHVSVGGWMGSVPNAGKDPIFWLHHCNIDRLWGRWLAQGGGRANPTDPAWLDRSFTFYNEAGQQITRKASQGLLTCPTLGYKYPTLRLLVNPALTARLLPLNVRLAQPIGDDEVPQQIVLAGRVTSRTVKTQRTPNVAESGQQTLLAFEGIRVRNPEGYYEIYINPAKTEGLTEADPSYAGNLVFFGAPIEGMPMLHSGEGHHEGADRRVFDVTEKLAELRRMGIVKGDDVNVVLVLRLPEGGSAQPEEGPEAVRATIGRMRLVTQ